MPQAKLTMMSRLLVGAFAYFAEDSESIGDDAPPDVAGGYEAVPSLGCIEQCAPNLDSQESEFLCPRETGGYERTVEQTVTADYLDLQVQNYSELVHRLQWGVDGAISEGVPKSPFKKRDRKVRGWLAAKAVNQDGETLLQLLLRVEVRLNTTPPFENSYGKPVLRFQALENELNAIEFGDDAS